MRRVLEVLTPACRAVVGRRRAATGAIAVGLLLASAVSAASAAPVHPTWASTVPTAAAPVVTGVSPAAGPVAGGTAVTITGAGFAAGGSAVDFGTVAATDVTASTTTSITAVAPAGTGSVDVTVTTAVATSVTSAADQFTYEAAPTVMGVSPDVGPLAGGTLVTVTGTGFIGATAVSFGGVPATDVTVNSATSISADAPAGGGPVDVAVTTPAGMSPVSAADQYTYADSTLMLTAPATYTVKGATATLYNLAGILYDLSAAELVSGRLVTFTVGNDTVCSGTTSTYGIASCSGTVPVSAVRPNHGYAVTFTAVPGLQAATAKGTLARLLGVFPVRA
jgi:hypothetical protein